MDDTSWLARRFDENRSHLRAVAYRMLGSASEADDAVQEAWLKTSRTDTHEVENLRGWLTTVTARVCLDMLRSRTARPQEPLGEEVDAPTPHGPDTELAIADAIGPALQIVLDMLSPAERVAFVLHDLFDLPFEVIGPIIERSPVAARQLASRARRRVRGGAAAEREVPEHRELVSAFLAASREGNFEALVALLAPDAVLRADELSLRTAAQYPGGAPQLTPEVRGAALVADAFKGRARAARAALIDGDAGAVWVMGGQIRAAFLFAFEHGKIAGLDLVMEPADLAELEVKIE
ncbi:MAG TPA: sigma-70 family RNA polymerase sigma factor [Kofleriaceae bacterium]|nr:sigma-70 family RNA polymerase sigma factor [Kofleriaceae bacterium]